MSSSNILSLKKRITWIDNLKAITIFFVVLGHVISLIDAPFVYNKYIYSFHLPLFYFVSGFLFKNEKYQKFSLFLKRRSKTLLVPYFVFAFLSFFTLFFLQYLGVYDFNYNFGGGVNTIFNPLFQILYSYNFIGPLWFLTSLFVVSMYFFILNKYVKNRISLVFILFISSIVGYLYSIYVDFGLPWHIEVALIGVVFYGVGNTFRKEINYYSDKIFENRFLMFIFLSTLLILTVAFSHFNDPVGLLINNYGNYFFFFIASFSGIFFYILISKIIPDFKAIRFIGKNTIIILCIHSFFYYVLLSLIYNYLKEGILFTFSNSIFLAIIFTFLLFIIMTPFIILINKYFPFLIGKN